MSRLRRPASGGPVVELVGIPGAGKSRLTRALVTDLTAQGVAVRTPQAAMGPEVPVAGRLARKAGVCAQAALRSPGTTARLARALTRSGQPGPADVAGRLVQWLVADALTGTAPRRPGVTVLDEGPLQALWSIGLRGDVTPVLAALDGRAATPGADVLVVVRVPVDVALSRLASRASRHSRVQQLDPADRLAELERGAAVLDRLVDWWAGATTPRSVAVVGGTDDTTARSALVERICAAVAADSAERPPDAGERSGQRLLPGPPPGDRDRA